MLDELKNLEYHGGKEGLLFFIKDVIGLNQITTQDAAIICSHAPGRQGLSVESLMVYCHAFGWIQVQDNVVSVSQVLIPFLEDLDALNEILIGFTVNQLFMEEILCMRMFSYDAVHNGYIFRNELFPLQYASVRNTLISQGFLFSERDSFGTHFYIKSEYESLIVKHCNEKRKQLSLEKLKKELEKNERAGEKAELFVLSYEQKRIGQPLSNKIKRISEVDVSAGYDIVSFASAFSLTPDRYIEVKAVSDLGFYWSKNEYEIAKLLADKYCLYLVELAKINEPMYSPMIIQNPASIVMESDDWLVEPQTYHIMNLQQV